LFDLFTHDVSLKLDHRVECWEIAPSYRWRS
jgi:hypothetical protein